MSEREFENYLVLLGRLLKLSGPQRDAVAQELRDHMAERLDALMAEGVSREEAITRALEEFGDAAGLADELTRIQNVKKRRWIMRATAGSIAATVVAILITLALWPDHQDALAPKPAVAQQGDGADQGKQKASARENRYSIEEAANAATEKKLAEPRSFDFVDVPLSEVVHFLSEELKVQSYIGLRALDDEGIPADTPITLQLADVPTSMALDLMLGEKDLTYTLRHGVVLITTLTEVEDLLDTRVYDVRDLLQAPAQIEWALNPAAVSLIQKDYKKLTDLLTKAYGLNLGPDVPFTGGLGGQSGIGGGLGGGGGFGGGLGGGGGGFGGGGGGGGGFGGGLGGGGGGGGIFQVVEDEVKEKGAKPSNEVNQVAARLRLAIQWLVSRPHLERELIELITQTIDPDMWEDRGGPGSMRIYSGGLVISQTYDVHREVDELLERLRLVTDQAQRDAADPEVLSDATQR